MTGADLPDWLTDCSDGLYLPGELLLEAAHGRIERRAVYAAPLHYPDRPDGWEWLAQDYMEAPDTYHRMSGRKAAVAWLAARRVTPP